MANGLLEQVVFVMSSQNQDRGPRLTYTHSLASMGDVGIRDHLMNATCLEIPSWTADLLQVLNSGPFYQDQQTYLLHVSYFQSQLLSHSGVHSESSTR